jgi:hypothetical protein
MDSVTEADLGRRVRLAAANGQPQQMAQLLSIGTSTAIVQLISYENSGDDDGVREVPFTQIEKVVRNA